MTEEARKEMEEAGKNDLRMRLAVAGRALECIGCTECDFIGPDACLVQYNVMAKGHCKYKSTVGYKHNW